eukprot:9054736-Prorocentrum_lima.AAC.1
MALTPGRHRGTSSWGLMGEKVLNTKRQVGQVGRLRVEGGRESERERGMEEGHTGRTPRGDG